MRYIPKPPPYGMQNPAQWWGFPISPSHPLRQAYNQFFFGALAPRWLAKQGGVSSAPRIRNGRGMLYHYTGLLPAEASVTIPHKLGRQAYAVMALTSAQSYTYAPRVRFNPGPNDNQQATIAFDQNVTDQWLYFV